MRIERHSPSSLNLFCASPAMSVLERILGHHQPVGAPAHRGTAVEDGVTVGLLDPDKPWRRLMMVSGSAPLSLDARGAQ
jgi:hypothetical protein